MVILVTANNYLLMFVGWEGSLLKCPKWLSPSDYSVLNFMFIMHTCNQKRFFFSRKLKSINRVGPHNLDVISLIVGSLLSNSYLEKRENGLGVRIIFIKYSNNVEYLMWFHSFFAEKGYCSNKKPKLSKLIGIGNKVLFFYSFKSYSFSSFIWLFDMFYIDNVKIIPGDLNKYFTPLALSTLFLSSVELGKNTELGKKAKLDTSLVYLKDFKYLSLILKNKYNIETIIKFNNSSGLYGGSLFIKNYSTFSKIVKPNILHSQYYLLNMPILKLNLFGTNRLYNRFNNTVYFSTSAYYRVNSEGKNNLVVPAIVYLNADINKEEIIKENKKKSGVYRWTNLTSGLEYIGSSVNLAIRFKYYYNYSSLTKKNMVINKAILKHGYSNFKLEILEYCNPEKCIEREQYYIDLLKPEYNILKTAGSTLGYKHTEETLAKFKDRKHTPERLAKIRAHLAQLNRSEEQRLAARERMLTLNEKKGIKVEVTDERTNITTTYDSIRNAADALSTDLKSLYYNEKVQKERGKPVLFKKYFLVKILRD